MSSFSIDDVRDSFKADVGLFLTRIEGGAQATLASPALQPAVVGSELGPAFATLADLGHAIFGTSALVGAESLHESARAIEELARAGSDAVAEMEAGAARARAIASACADGAQAMRQMLADELDRRGDAALVAAKRWLAGIAALRADELSPSVPAPAAASVVSFRVPAPVLAAAVVPEPQAAAGSVDEAWCAPTEDAEMFEFGVLSVEEMPIDALSGESGPESVFHFEEPAGGGGFDGELLEIFRREGRENVRALDAALAQLRAQPGDMNAVAGLERLYHTMKGAAAIVGLEEVSRATGEIQERLEALLERGSAATGEMIAGLVADTDGMLRRAGLPALAAPAPAAPAAKAPPPAAAAHGFFVEEVQELAREAHGLLDELASSSAETSLRARLELAKLFHRLKGSALLVGETRVGGEAEKIQALFESDGAGASTAAVDLGPAARSSLTRIAALLGTEAPSSAAVDGASVPSSAANRSP